MRHHGHHRRRNPGGNLIWGVAGAAGGFLLTGSLAGMVAPSGVMNYVAQGAVALGGGWAIRRYLKPAAGHGFIIGGLASLAIKLYSDFTGSGMSYYADVTNPVQDYVTGNPLKWPAHAVAGAPALRAAAAPAAAASSAGSGGWSPRFQSRLFSKAA